MKAHLPLIIVNPKSGKGLTERRWASYATAIRTHLGPFDCEFTKAPGHATEIARKEAEEGRELIVVFGGDGTVSETANGILKSKSKTALGLLPGGSGSDFRRTLNVPANFVDAVQKLKQGTEHLIDAGQITYLDHQGKQQKRFFVNTASFGMSGAVAGRANRSGKFLGGTLSYATATMRTALSFDAPEIVLTVDDQTPKRLKVVIVCVANGPSFGGGMRIAPNAKLDDGMFDVVIAGDIKAVTLLLNSYKLYSGTHLTMEKMALIQAQKIHATSVDQNHAVLLEVDGETPGRLPATIEILPKVLRVRY
jgi:YegS/Rv2252/BmrU family lipid kinase